jgi:hypothetical protein
MGFLNLLSGRSKEERHIEREIQAKITQSLIEGIPMKDATDIARMCIKEAKKKIRKAGRQRPPSNYGDVLLRREKTVLNVAKEFQKIRREGVTDEDIRVYWNAPELWRTAMEQLQQFVMFSAWREAAREGKSNEEAAVHVRKFLPYWGDADDTRVTSGDDRPLPAELARREDQWTTRERERHGDQALKERCANSSSYNAIIRAEIRAGRL